MAIQYGVGGLRGVAAVLNKCVHFAAAAMYQKAESFQHTAGEVRVAVRIAVSAIDFADPGIGAGFGYPPFDPQIVIQEINGQQWQMSYPGPQEALDHEKVRTFAENNILPPQAIGMIVVKGYYHFSLVAYNNRRHDKPLSPVEQAQILLAGVEVVDAFEPD
jgi:hypothetical protein